jgi:hypothetical protein
VESLESIYFEFIRVVYLIFICISYDNAIDVWSAGCIAAELFMGIYFICLI